MLRTEPAVLSLPGPSGATGFHPTVATSTQACSDRSGHAALTVPAINLPALQGRHVVPPCRVCSSSPHTSDEPSHVRSRAEGWS